MNTKIYGLALSIALTTGISGCVMMSGAEAKFAASPYGTEIQGMVEKCKEMQTNGLLPGVSGDEDKLLSIESGVISFSSRNNVTYPLEGECHITHSGEKSTFVFVKQSKQSEWEILN